MATSLPSWAPQCLMAPEGSELSGRGGKHDEVAVQAVLTVAVSFLSKRQWLPKSKMVPLGIDETIDKLKMMEGRNSSIRKAVRIAFDRATNHLSRVHGEPASDLSDID